MRKQKEGYGAGIIYRNDIYGDYEISESINHDVAYSKRQVQLVFLVYLLIFTEGLEWPCVFIIGCEETIIPHSKADAMEER